MNSIVPFDYGALAGEDAAFIQSAAARIHVRLERTGKDIIDVGNDLIAVKGRIGHGNFGSWLSAEFSMTERTAQKFMGVAETYSFKNEPSSDLIENYSPSAMYELLDAPAEVQEEAAQQAQNGKVTGADIRKYKDEIKKLRDQRDTARREKRAKEGLIDQLSNRISSASNEILCLQDELKKLKEINPKEAFAVENSIAAEEQDEIVKRMLCMSWEIASPKLRGWFLDEFVT